MEWRIGEEDILEGIARFERGEMHPEEWAALFQEIVDTGQLARVGPHYQEMARGMMDAGLIHERKLHN